MQRRFTSEGLLGTGGQGRVFAVHDAGRGGARFALKERSLSSSDELREEFELLARLRHPHIAAVYDWLPISPIDGEPGQAACCAYTQDLVSGEDFFKALKSASDAEQDEAVIQVFRALAYLHALQVVHLDLKPDNVFVDITRDEVDVHVLDFGIARKRGVITEYVMGSRSYIAPERLRGDPVDPRADLYALGVMMAEVSSGKWLTLYSLPELRNLSSRRAYLEEVGVRPAWLNTVVALTSFEPEERPGSVFEAASLFAQGIKRSVALQTPATVAAILRAGAPVGRDDAVTSLVEDARHGVARVLVGPSGIGRTTLARQVGRRLQLEGHPLEVWPATDMGQAPKEFSALLRRVLGEDGGFEEIEIGLDWDVERASGLDPKAIERELSASVRQVAPRLLSLDIQSPRPVVVIERYESAPWPVRFLLKTLIEHSEEEGALPLGLVVVADAYAGSAGLNVGPLTRDDIAGLLEQRLGKGVSSQALAAALAGASGGHPGELEALLALMAQRGELSFGPQGWVGPQDDAISALPAGFGAALRARLELLDTSQRALLSAVAWMRFPATEAELNALLGQTRSKLETLSDLAAIGLIRTLGNGAWVVSHDEVGVALEGWVPEGGEAAAHTRVLERAEPQGLALAWHLGGAQGAELALDIGDAALAAGAIKDAESAYILAEELAPSTKKVLLRRASVADLLGPREVQMRCLEALIETAENGSREKLRAQARLLWTLTCTSDLEGASALGGQVLQLAEALGDEGVYRAALVDLGNVAVQKGDYDQGERLLLKAQARTKESEAPGDAARIANNLGNILAHRGESASALDAYGEALRLKELEGDPVGARIATGNMGLMCLRLGRSGEALGHFARSLRSAKTLGHRRGEAWCLLAIAVLGVRGGAWAFAERRARAAHALASRLGDRIIGCEAKATLAEVLAAMGKLTEAVDEAEAALEEALALDIGYSISVARAVLARILLESKGDAVRARSLAEQVLEESSVHPTYRATALCVLAELEMGQGQLTSAWARMEEALQGDANEIDERVWTLALRILPLHEPSRALSPLVAEVRGALADVEQAWPDAPCDDGVDEAAGVDAPSRSTWRQKGAVLALNLQLDQVTSAGGAMQGDDTSGASRVEEVATEHKDWHELLLGSGVAGARALLTEIVASTGAERAFLVDADMAVIASANLDGDSVTDAARKVSSESLHQAGRAGGIWRGRTATGVVWCAQLSDALGATSALILENRFNADAFEGLHAIPESGRLRLVLYLRGLREALKQAEARAEQSETARHDEAMRSTMHLMDLRRALEATREQLGPKKLYSEIIYDSALMQRMLLRVEKVVDSDLPVWISGESGTGKELVARALHRHGNRSNGPFVAQNCGAIPATLFESEFFGHVRGAFTGAHKDQEGLFRRADSGTLFLDEVGDLPLEQQTKLLRVIETGEVQPVGGSEVFKVNVRLVCATHQDLKEKVSEGSFREDLFYRLNVVKVDVPSLRDRPEDIPLLVEHFLGQGTGAAEGGTVLGSGVLKALMAHAWPGNVRELENELMRASLLCDGGVIGLGDLSDTVRRSRGRPMLDVSGEHLAPLGLTSGTLKERVDRLEYVILKDALTQGANKSQIARELGLSRAGLNMKLKRLGLWDKG